jgi:hypothetical protein
LFIAIFAQVIGQLHRGARCETGNRISGRIDRNAPDYIGVLASFDNQTWTIDQSVARKHLRSRHHRLSHPRRRLADAK